MPLSGPQLREPSLAVCQDLAMYINEVKRDKETLKKISEFQSSIENLVRVTASRAAPSGSAGSALCTARPGPPTCWRPLASPPAPSAVWLPVGLAVGRGCSPPRAALLGGLLPTSTPLHVGPALCNVVCTAAPLG